MKSESESDGQREDSAVMARVCWSYFKEGQTQEAIAQQLGLTRKRVNRILNDARVSGFVQITLNDPIGACAELEARLQAAYGLRRAIIVPAPPAGLDVRTVVGAAAGQYVSGNLAAGASLGIAWGGTINAAAQNILSRRRQGNTVVLLCGGLARSTSINPYDNAAMFARALDATCYYVTAPMFAESADLRKLLIASDAVRAVLQMTRRLDMALLSAVDLSRTSRALEYGVISRDTWRSLRAAGAVGDICGHYLDIEGSVVDHPIARRTINPPLADLQSVKELVLAAGGAHKAPIILGAIRAGLCHILITDEAAATAVLATTRRWAGPRSATRPPPSSA